jgi:hypothetical protein
MYATGKKVKAMGLKDKSVRTVPSLYNLTPTVDEIVSAAKGMIS